MIIVSAVRSGHSTPFDLLFLSKLQTSQQRYMLRRDLKDCNVRYLDLWRSPRDNIGKENQHSIGVKIGLMRDKI